MTTVIHWFRRDLRVEDNTALIAACDGATHLIPVFIFDDRLLQSRRVAGSPRIGFMLDTLLALQAQLREYGSDLVVRRGDPVQVLVELAQATQAKRVTFNRDYSPYAVRRDLAVGIALQQSGVLTDSYADLVMHEPYEIKNGQGAPLQVFTPYKKRWITLPKALPHVTPPHLPPLPNTLDPGTLPDLAAIGGTRAAHITTAGEVAAQKILANFVTQKITAYDEQRNQVDLDGTSRLSPHLRWGSISVRQCYDAARKAVGRTGNQGAETWISELVWREFYYMVLSNFPHVLTNNYRPQYDLIQWQQDDTLFEAWCAGQTGYPIVDAAMRQMNQTGWMHNRARMITASFLCKDLLIDWRQGELYFMQRLIDGDTAANNGGWQWTAGTGTDAAPYFRIFNPVSQGEKFDPNGDYVRRWIPELAYVPTKFIHQPWHLPEEQRRLLNYPTPIVDHAVQRELALQMYGQGRS